MKPSLLLMLCLLPLKLFALDIFACEPEWAALSTELGGDHVKVYTATDASQDPHHVQARPGLISRMRKADLVVCTGADLEIGWLPVLLAQSGNTAVTHEPGLFYADTQVTLLNKPTTLDRAQGDIHPDGNPHAYLDPERLLTIARALSDRMRTLDPVHADAYQQRWEDFAKRWQTAIGQWRQQAAPLHGVAVIVHHDEWIYLLNWLGMIQVGELEPKPGLPPTPAHLADLAATARTSGARLIVRAPHNSADASQWLAAHTTACAVELPFTVGGSKAATDLFGLYGDTLTRLLDTMGSCHHD